MAKTIMKEKEAEENITANNGDEPLNLSANSTVSVPSSSVIGTIIDIAMNNTPNNASEGMFLDWWNTIKSFSNLLQWFSCQLNEGITKICKKIRLQVGFWATPAR